MKHFAAVLLVSLLALPAVAQDMKHDDAMKDCPMHEKHQVHHAGVESQAIKQWAFHTTKPRIIFAWRQTAARLK